MRSVIFRIVGPLLLLGLAGLALFLWVNRFPLPAAIINLLPLIALLVLLRSFRRKRSVMFYLVMIDGMMIVKALLGLLASGWV